MSYPEISVRAHPAVPHCHWRTSTFLAGLRIDRWGAPLVLDGAITGDAFLAYSSNSSHRPWRSATLSSLPSGQPQSHRCPTGDRGTRCELVVPAPYSPDRTRSKQAFAKLKQFVRSAASRTRATLWNTLGSAISCFSATECGNFFAHAGYTHSA